MQRFWPILTAITLMCGHEVFAAAPKPAQDAASFAVAHEKAVAANAPGLTFTLRTKDGHTTFHAGERIPIELTFENHSNTAYNVLGFNAPRGVVGRVDRFVSDRPGDAVDPQEFTEHEHSTGFSGFLALAPLNTLPVVTGMDLNTWIALDQPGIYQLYDQTYRVTIDKDKYESAFHLPTSPNTRPLASNIITITILPHDAIDDQKAIQASLTNLNRDHPWPAFHTIEYIRTLPAGQALLQLVEEHWPYPQQSGFQQQIIATLADSPYKPELLQILTGDFKNRDVGINDMAIEAYVVLAFHSQLHINPAEAYIFSDSKAEYRRKTLAFLKTEVEKKRGSARAISLATLSFVHSYTDKEPYTRELISCFDLLPLGQQYDLLTSDTPFAHDKAMQPALLRILASPYSAGTPGQKLARSAALEQLIEIDPLQARKIIMTEMTRKWPTVNPESLIHMPGPIPNIDDVLLRNFRDACAGHGDLVTQSFLIGHFATGAIRQPIEEIYLQRRHGWQILMKEHNRYFDEIQYDIPPALFAYFYRVDSAFAEAQRASIGGLIDYSWTSMAFISLSPGLEGAISAALRDPNLDIVIYAADALAHYGSARHKSMLISALQPADASNKKIAEANKILIDDLKSAKFWTLTEDDYKAIAQATHSPISDQKNNN